MPIASLDEIGDLLRRLRVDDAAKPRRLSARRAHHPAMICDHPNLNSANTRMTRDHFLCVVGLKFVEMSVVKQTLEQFSRVIRLTMVLGNDVVQLFDRTQ